MGTPLSSSPANGPAKIDTADTQSTAQIFKQLRALSRSRRLIYLLLALVLVIGSIGAVLRFDQTMQARQQA